MTFAYGVTVTVIRSAGRDRWGDLLPAIEHTIEGCVLYPRSSVELVDGRDTIITGTVLLAPLGADIRATDRVRLADGSEHDVRGTPGTWLSPLTGWAPGIQAVLEEVTG